MIYVGIDDTDMPGTPGTNQHAKALVEQLADRFSCRLIVRHQLLLDPRVPYTSKNSAASLTLEPRNGSTVGPLVDSLRTFLRDRLIEGSDPGFCVATSVAPALVEYGRQCQRELVTQRDARLLAADHGVHLEGCGGTRDGVIGALAAVGLIHDGNDGRVVQIGDWPDDLSGPQDVETLHARGVEVRDVDTGTTVVPAAVDVGKHLRPNYRENRIVLFARPPLPAGRDGDPWQAVRLT